MDNTRHFNPARVPSGWLFVSGVLIALSVIYAEYRVYVHYESQRNVEAFDEYLAELTRLDNRAKDWRMRSAAQDLASPAELMPRHDRCIVGQRLYWKPVERPC